MKSNSTANGFTLIEIMLALLIFAIIAVITSSVMITVFNTRDAVNQQMQRLAQLQLTVILLQRDFTQAVLRSTLDNQGSRQPGFVGDAKQVSFISMGYHNPEAREQQSQLQKVEYILKDGNFIRRTWQQLDQAPQSQASDRILLSRVNSIELNYLSQEQQVLPFWNSQAHSHLPKAIILSLKLPDWGALTLWLPIPSRYASQT